MKRPTNYRGVRTRKITEKSNQNAIKSIPYNLLNNIKNIQIFKTIFKNIDYKPILGIIKYNKLFQ